MKNSIIIPISADPVTGTARQALLENFVIQPDLNMLNQVRVQYLESDGRLKLDVIAADDSLSPYQKQVASLQFADRVTNRQTSDSFTDPATGAVVDKGTPNAIPQRDYFQAITLADLKTQGITVNDQTTLAELMYTMLGLEIQKSDQRKEI